MDLLVRAPADLARFLAVLRAPFGDIVPMKSAPSFASLLAAAKTKPAARARLTALLGGALPFATTRRGALWLYLLAGSHSPARGVIATLEPRATSPRLVCRGAAALAVLCIMQASGEAPSGARIPAPGVAEEEAFRSELERARVLSDLLVGTDAKVRAAARTLAKKPMAEAPPPDTRRRLKDREGPLALGALVETFFREGAEEARAVAAMHERSEDALVAQAARVVAAALDPKTSGPAADLARRRAMALRAARSVEAPSSMGAARDPMALTRAVVAKLAATPRPADPSVLDDVREECLLALADLGDRAIVPSLVARAVTGDIDAVDMLGVLGDERAVPHLIDMLGREPGRQRQLEVAVVRALGALGAKAASKALRRMLDDNPMTSWRDGLERAPLVRELVTALGALRDEAAGHALVAILEATSQEYKSVLPIAAWALGRIAHVEALRALERLLCSPKEPITCEALWAVGEIGRRHANVKKRAGALLDGIAGLEPGAEMTRLTALAKIRGAAANAPRVQELRRALERALWEPGFRKEETARRRMWALRALTDLHAVKTGRRRDDAFFLGHEAVRHLVTRDDPRVRRGAEEAFSTWGVPVPKARCYYSVVVDELEREGGIDALHEALRDPLGVYRHNAATRLAERGDPRSVRPLAEATARLFAEPPTSTYEYDDAPKNLVAFVRALARLNAPEGNDVLIDGLRTGNHQVRAVVAENAPDDARFVPELRAMLGDPRSFLRSRAERSLTSLGALPALGETGSSPPPRLAPV